MFTLVATSGCGGGSKLTAPDVRGMALPDAETTLAAAQVGYSEHAQDGLLGILVKADWVVCKERQLSAHMVQLDAAKHGC